ncbi:M55 family metallopeptidase [Thermococcus sp.]|uniref:M55 family metallopeptidase n=1 Tax=Thermococcus sp. TaxID=35749 RepID=UPI00260AA41C|nr:M55 family metallopeptidase [Thermococcus sp.]
MKAFVSIDLEGLPHVVSVEHLLPKGALYGEARKIATRVAKAVAEALHKEGFEEVVIADSHGPMVNVLPDEMPGYARLVRGFPRPLSMVAGAKGADIAVFLGYHAKAGTGKATFDHTYSSSSVASIEVNGKAVSEALLNAYLLGEWGIPVIMVAGDRRLIEDDLSELSGTVGVVLKDSFSRYSSVSPAMETVETLLRKGVAEAVGKWKEGLIKPLRTKTPVEVKLRFLSSAFADSAELCPLVERIDGRSVVFRAKNVEEAYRMIELLILASAGVSSILRR